jgi:hypothetical protein
MRSRWCPLVSGRGGAAPPPPPTRQKAKKKKYLFEITLTLMKITSCKHEFAMKLTTIKTL